MTVGIDSHTPWCRSFDIMVKNRHDLLTDRQRNRTANFSVKKSLGHHDFAYDIVAESHPTPHKCVQGFLKYSLGINLAILGCFNWIHGAKMSKKEQKLHKNRKFGVAILVTAWAPKLFFFQAIYVFIIFFVWTCYSHTDAYRLGPS